MKGKMGHRPGFDFHKHDMEGTPDKTKAGAGKVVKNRHKLGATDSSVGRFGKLRLKEGEGKADKNVLLK